MQRIPRSFTPLWITVALALAGCQAVPAASDAMTASTGSAADESATSASASAAEGQAAFYIGQTHSEPSLTAIKTANGMLYVQRTPVLVREDIRQANALIDKQGKHFVGLRFTESGARKLNDVSAQNVGKRLVLILDGKIAAAPNIGQPLNRGVLAFSVPSAQAAASLAARIRGEKPPELKPGPRQ